MRKVRQAIIKHLWWIIALLGITLLICHSLQIATITVDPTSLALLAIILLSPFVAAIKRIKIGDFEAEIDPEEVKRVTEEVASKIPATQISSSESEEEHPAISSIRQLAKTDPVIALAKLRIELEMRLRRLRNRATGRRTSARTVSLHNIIDDLASREILPRDLIPPIRDVLALCNRAIHGEAIRDEDAAAVIRAGEDMLREFDRLVREYGIAHPIEKATITQAEADAYLTAQYRLVTIIPLVDSPRRVTYILTQDELEDFFEGYFEFAEFVVSVERTETHSQ